MFPSAGGVSDRQPTTDRDDEESSANLSRSFVRETGIIPAAWKEGVNGFGQTRLQSISLNHDPRISLVGVEANFSGLHGDVPDVVQSPKFQNVVGRELAGSDLEIEDQVILAHSPKQDDVGMFAAVVVCGGILGVHAKTKRNWKRLARKGSGDEVVKQVSDRKRKGEITSSRPTVDGSELAKKMKSNIAVGVRHHRQIDAFRSTVNDCGLVDLGYVGAKFTWCNHRQDGLVRERLDCGLAIATWMRAFPHARVLHLVCTTSDHVPIFLDVEGHKSTPFNQGWRSPIYRFEAIWLPEEECEEVVRNNWSLERDSTVRGLRRNLESVRSGLLSWSQTKFGDVRRRVRDKGGMDGVLEAIISRALPAVSSHLDREFSAGRLYMRSMRIKCCPVLAILSKVLCVQAAASPVSVARMCYAVGTKLLMG
ncbi:hypothetical protein LOK49_LG08G01486 [Camellia lanceoleosa]|uniref:Uncharacterized protein n=1 Tax=Camellia lanceoleosa TaxID=1840588 RepID=A0ACC0GX44_9ERIC|nr:hypothetical protein LOK49_LG08G01486 [Camellia lanceoleosa]